MAYSQTELDKKCIIVITKIYKKVDDEEGWVVLSWAQAPDRQNP